MDANRRLAQSAARFPEVQQRFALVVYRDEGDAYVAKSFNFASLDAFHAELSRQRAGGGGDTPEAVHRGFEEANQLRWLERDAARWRQLRRKSRPITALTGTPSEPSGTTILPSVPSSIASTSIVALSVSISAITSPADTWSPSPA